jgi:methylthioribulose-1-phosphate dehydratase
MLPSKLRNELLQAVQYFHQKGWSPATTTTHSYRNTGNQEGTFTITAAHIDRGALNENHLINIDSKGRPTCEVESLQVPADARLHTMMYENENINAILHTHSVNGTVLSLMNKEKGEIEFSSYEALQALSGIAKNQEKLSIPVFAHHKDSHAMCDNIRKNMGCNHKTLAFLVVGHGLYSWGESIEIARKQIELFEFIFACEVLYRQLRGIEADAFH